MKNLKNVQTEVTGGYENFTERGGFEDIYVSYDSEELRYFLDGAKALVEELKMYGVEAVLDVGTGTGHTALELAKRYPNCKVVGVDNSPGMLRQAQLKKGNINNITFLKHDWEQLESLQGKFDVVLNSFGVSFVKNMERFAKSVASKVKPNGIFAYINFDESSFAPVGMQLFTDLEQMSLLRKLPTSLSPANKLLVKLMEDSGFKTLKYVNKKLEYTLESPEQWWTIVSRTAIKENFFYELTEDELEAFKYKHLSNIQQMIDNGRNKFEVVTTIFIGKYEVM